MVSVVVSFQSQRPEAIIDGDRAFSI